MASLTIVILGGTGDLAKKKLLPAILALTKKKVVDVVHVVAIGRRPLDLHEYEELMGLKSSPEIVLHYFQADFEQKKSLADLSNFLASFEDDSCMGRLFYLAISPKYFGDVAKELSSCCVKKSLFNRILIEKPFGYDLESFQKLDKSLIKHFREESIFRVDHYLGKETVQNLLMLRLSNPFFERTWNAEFIDEIRVLVSEEAGVGNRIAYYDSAGAIRDMIQNHLLQVLSFVLMDAPQSVDATVIHEKKIRALKSLSSDVVAIGQYDGYMKELEKNNLPSSNTETFVKLGLKSSMSRWKNTKITLVTGKHLAERYARIEILYRKDPCLVYCDLTTRPNTLVINIQPRQDVEFHMNMFAPEKKGVMPVQLLCSEKCTFNSNSPESYEVILEESIHGNKTLFVSSKELAASWSLVDDILLRKGKPLNYKKGEKIEDVMR
jgi:glucose-6-phosphate 1-dehydrogenase